MENNIYSYGSGCFGVKYLDPAGNILIDWFDAESDAIDHAETIDNGSAELVVI